jgi:hypothetical protein
MHTYTDEWGKHEHTIDGPPYDPSKAITCASCIAMLDSRMLVWLDKLTAKHSLPENFWNGYKFSWS